LHREDGLKIVRFLETSGVWLASDWVLETGTKQVEVSVAEEYELEERNQDVCVLFSVTV